jgi:hypothetical protein
MYDGSPPVRKGRRPEKVQIADETNRGATRMREPPLEISESSVSLPACERAEQNEYDDDDQDDQKNAHEMVASRSVCFRTTRESPNWLRGEPTIVRRG